MRRDRTHEPEQGAANRKEKRRSAARHVEITEQVKLENNSPERDVRRQQWQGIFVPIAPYAKHRERDGQRRQRHLVPALARHSGDYTPDISSRVKTRRLAGSAESRGFRDSAVLRFALDHVR